MKEVVQQVVQRGAWHVHPENLLMGLLWSDSQVERKFAAETIKKIRGEN